MTYRRLRSPSCWRALACEAAREFQTRRSADINRAAGEPWRAKLLERQARGRWVEREVKLQFKEVNWSRRGVDAVVRRTGIKYEVLSGTDDNLNHHAKRMAGEMFRMITF